MGTNARIPGFCMHGSGINIHRAYRKLYAALIQKNPHYSLLHSSHPDRPDLVRYLYDHRKKILAAAGRWKLAARWHGFTLGGKRLTIELGDPDQRRKHTSKGRVGVRGRRALHPVTLASAYQYLYRALISSNDKLRSLPSWDPRRPDIQRYVNDHTSEILHGSAGWRLPDKLRMFTIAGKPVEFDLSEHNKRLAPVARGQEPRTTKEDAKGADSAAKKTPPTRRSRKQ